MISLTPLQLNNSHAISRNETNKKILFIFRAKNPLNCSLSNVNFFQGNNFVSVSQETFNEDEVDGMQLSRKRQTLTKKGVL